MNKEKMLLVLHLQYLDQEILAHQVYLDQLAIGWPGLTTEVEHICEELNIENVNTTKCSQIDYEQILPQAYHIKNESNLREMAEGKGKFDLMAIETYGQKEYIEHK